MSPELPSLVFMGTPDFAVPSLKKLVEAGARVPLVVTQPDRPSGRGKKVSPSPVKLLAESLGIPVFQPERIRGTDATEKIREYGAECAVVVAFGQILPQNFLDAQPLGAINVHGSLLPRYRGAAPIQRSLMAGDAVTGISIMLLDAGMDTGPVLSQRELSVGEHENFQSVYEKLSMLGADLLCDTLRLWKAGLVQPQPQDGSLATAAPPIRKEELKIDWQLPARQIVNTIRAFDPWPGAYGLHQGKRLKLFGASFLPWKGEGRPGEILGPMEKGLVVLAGDAQAVAIAEIQMEGQKRLSAADFLRGRALPPGSCLD
ncbi:MAG: methionyl-tRNA formyltransferase [Acidobacteriota bacterium]